MDFVCICNNCGKTIGKDFIYCPWCGKENTEPADKTVLDHVFSQLEVKQTADRNSRIKKIETRIEELERELNSFLDD